MSICKLIFFQGLLVFITGQGGVSPWLARRPELRLKIAAVQQNLKQAWTLHVGGASHGRARLSKVPARDDAMQKSFKNQPLSCSPAHARGYLTRAFILVAAKGIEHNPLNAERIRAHAPGYGWLLHCD